MESVRQPDRTGSVRKRDRAESARQGGRAESARQGGRLDAALSRPAPAFFFALFVLVVGAAALHALVQAHEDRMHLATGRAAWIWYASKVPEPRPLRFWATCDFTLPAQPARAMAKVFVDREHVLYVNGARAGGATQRPGDPLALYDVAAMLVEGPNRIAIEAASPTGEGGLLFSMDVENFGRDAVVSGGGWRVDLDASARDRGGRYRPVVWGRPPQYPWGYPRMPRPNELGERE
jgi:hypothetical protein